MAKKVIISESMFAKILANNLLEEANLSKEDVTKIVKDSFKNDRELNKNVEKKVKELVAKTINTLFRTLWQRRNFYEDEIKNA